MIDQPKPPSPGGDDLHDEHIDALWAATRAEGPSPDIDAALRAAARREIGAGPGPTKPRVAEATRWERWWWPLAAAATIGAVAIGLLQLTPNERSEPAVVSDMPAQGARKAEVSGAKPPAASGGAETRVDAPAPVAPPAPEKKRDGARDTGQADRAPAPPPPNNAPERRREIDRVQNPAEQAQDKLATRPLSALPSSSKAQPTPAAPALAPVPAVSPPPTSPASAPPAPVPFPVDAAKDSSGAPRAAAEAAAGSIVAGTAHPNEGAMMQKQAAPAPRALSAPGSLPTGAASPPAPLAKVAPTQSSAETAKPAVRPAAEWIALIRRLRDENKLSEAAKELTAFRAAYPDADRLLPQDLRDWHPPAAGTNPQ